MPSTPDKLSQRVGGLTIPSLFNNFSVPKLLAYYSGNVATSAMWNTLSSTFYSEACVMLIINSVYVTGSFNDPSAFERINLKQFGTSAILGYPIKRRLQQQTTL